MCLQRIPKAPRPAARKGTSPVKDSSPHRGATVRQLFADRPSTKPAPGLAFGTHPFLPANGCAALQPAYSWCGAPLSDCYYTTRKREKMQLLFCGKKLRTFFVWAGQNAALCTIWAKGCRYSVFKNAASRASAVSICSAEQQYESRMYPSAPKQLPGTAATLPSVMARVQNSSELNP